MVHWKMDYSAHYKRKIVVTTIVTFIALFSLVCTARVSHEVNAQSRLINSTSQYPKAGMSNEHAHDTEGIPTKRRLKKNPHHLLLKDLLDNYDSRVRPVMNYSQTVNVSVRLTLHLIRELDEKNQFLIVNVWFRFFWKDEYLTWKSSDYDGVKRIHVLSSQIWRPDIVLYNSVDEERTAVELLSDTNIELAPDGTASWTTPALLKSACKINIDLYPFDVQHCPLKLGSWTYHGQEVNVSAFSPRVMRDNYITNGEWDIVDAPCVRNEVHYSCCPESYPDVTCTLVIRRRPLFYIYNLVVPCFLLIFIGSLAFCLPPESGEKVSLAMTVLLAMTVFMLVVMENIPPTSEVVPLLEQFIGATIVLLSLSVGTSIFTVNCHFKGHGSHRPPAWIRKIVLDYAARLVFMETTPSRSLRNCFRNERKSKAGSKMLPRKENGCVQSSGTQPRDTSVMLAENGRLRLDIHDISPQSIEMTDRHSMSQTDSRFATSDVIDVLYSIQARLDNLVQFVNRKDDVSAVELQAKDEWRTVSIILDRICFVIFICLVLVTAVSIFAGIPSDSEFVS